MNINQLLKIAFMPDIILSICMVKTFTQMKQQHSSVKYFLYISSSRAIIRIKL